MLVEMRRVDDNFRLVMNKVNGSVEGECSQAWNRILSFLNFREHAIQTCLKEAHETGERLRLENDANRKQELRKLERKVDLLNEELEVEIILKKQAKKNYTKTCKNFVIKTI